MSVLNLAHWPGRLIVTGIIVVVAFLLLGLLGWVVARLVARVPQAADPVRQRQRRTATAVLVSLARYLVLIGAAVSVVIVLAGGGGLGALGGTAFVAIIVGFASQRFLFDVIAGFFILFEGQYSVGDFVRLEPSGYTGVVEEIGLRTTALRDLSGDHCFVPNGQISAARRLPTGWRSFQLELLTRDPDAILGLAREISELVPAVGVRFLREPREADRRGVGGGLVAQRLTVDVAPSLEPLLDGLFVPALRARAGDLLVAEPLVLALDPAVVQSHQASVALR